MINFLETFIGEQQRGKRVQSLRQPGEKKKKEKKKWGEFWLHGWMLLLQSYWMNCGGAAVCSAQAGGMLALSTLAWEDCA